MEISNSRSSEGSLVFLSFSFSFFSLIICPRGLNISTGYESFLVYQTKRLDTSELVIPTLGNVTLTLNRDKSCRFSNRIILTFVLTFVESYESSSELGKVDRKEIR